MTLLNDRCRVVLVRPTIAANIGAVARVMRNFGLSQLVVVAPEADPLDPEARKLSTQGESILHAARTFSEFGAAVADCVLVVGTSARSEGVFRSTSAEIPAALMPRFVDAAQHGPVALVFGPEPTGLTNTEVARCHHLITIPTDESYPALNLAQAVAICLYEFHQAVRALSGEPQPRAIAPFAAQERMFESLEEALRELHFLWGENADALMHALRHLIGRAQPTPQEVELLFGVERQIRWFAREHHS